jgi:plastocyanin domain-containing protein
MTLKARTLLEGYAMSIADIIVVLVSAAAIAGLGWFFFAPRKAHTAQLADGVQRVAVVVRGGYHPDVIRVRQGVPVELIFDRQESGDCTSRVVFGDFALSAALPAYEQTTVRLTTDGIVRVRVRNEHGARHAAGRSRWADRPRLGSGRRRGPG